MRDGLYEYCPFTITDSDITDILIRGTFAVTEVYSLLKTDLPTDFSFSRIAEELNGEGIDPVKTRLVCSAVNMSGIVPGAQEMPKIQIVMVPF